MAVPYLCFLSRGKNEFSGKNLPLKHVNLWLRWRFEKKTEEVTRDQMEDCEGILQFNAGALKKNLEKEGFSSLISLLFSREVRMKCFSKTIH